MEYKSVKGFTGWAQFGFLFAFIGFGFIVGGGIQYLLTMQILPAGASITDSKAAMKAMFAPENINTARAIQVLGTFGLMFIPAILWSIVSNGTNMFWLGFNKYVNGFQILLGFMIIFAASFVAAPLADLSKSLVAHFPALNATAKQMEATYNEQALALSNLKNLNEYIVGLFIMAFFPALFEEIFFRGMLQNFFTKWWGKPILAITVTSLVFSLIHMSIFLFASRFALGFVLGLLFYKTKNIWVNVVAHFLNNAFALTGLYVMRMQNKPLDLDKLDPQVHWSIGIIGIVALTGLFLVLKKYSQKNVEKIDAKEYLLMNKNGNLA